jgi:hypothetical protein
MGKEFYERRVKVTTREELDLFLVRADEFIESKYILADMKVVNLLKAIAVSEKLLALFENCLKNFDYHQAKKNYLVKSKYLSGDKGEYVAPKSSRELLAFVFYLLMDIDSKRILLGEFVNKYFYEDGSFSAAYANFINHVIKPFRDAVKVLMLSIIEGKLQDPLEALTEMEEKRAKELADLELQERKNKELLKKAYGESVIAIKEILLADKTKIKESKKKDKVKSDVILVIDMLANVIESEDKDAIEYAFISYSYMTKNYPFTFFRRSKKISKLLKGIYDEI